MCGIVGYFGEKVGSINREALLVSIKHRGPDETGVYVDHRSFLGHQRLSIVDISDGQQPFVIGNKILVFNGEIYNYLFLRAQLEESGVQFSTSSDTEVLLRAYLYYGNSFVDRLDGMFAFIIYDKVDGSVLIARDNYGIKPLYVWMEGQGFGFSSEVFTLLQLKAQVAPETFSISSTALSEYIRVGHTGEYPISDNVFLLEKGKLFLYSAYRLRELAPIDFRYSLSSKDLFSNLQAEVDAQLHADVEVGVFLSGGIDSSLLTALASNHRKEISTFSIGFDGEKSVDESKFARFVANKFGTNHHEFTFNEQTLLKYIPQLIECLDMPMYDPAMLPMLYLCDMTSKHVKVVLSGDGGDELFGGYTHHRVKKYGRIFRILEVLLGLFSWLPKILNLRITIGKLLEKTKGVDVVSYDQNEGLDLRLLRKTDLCSMRYGVEVRVPFLSKRVTALSLSKDYWSYVGLVYGKQPLRKLVNKLINSDIAYKRKQGFRIPIKKWITEGELSTEIETALLNTWAIPQDVISQDQARIWLNERHIYYQELFSLYILNGWLNKLRQKTKLI